MIGELMMAYDIKTSNKTLYPGTLCVLYIRPNDGGTGHSVFKFSTKQLLPTSKCNPVPMPEDVF